MKCHRAELGVGGFLHRPFACRAAVVASWHSMKSTPRSPSELRKALAAIFPMLPRDFGEQGESVFENAGPTYGSMLRDFAGFFAKNADQFSERQLARFAELVVRVKEVPGPLEDAVESCFLEPTRELKVHDRLEPFLAAAAKGARK